jgi:CheY-like chemotaxis protein
MTETRPIALVEDNEDDIFFTQGALRDAGVPNRLVILKDARTAMDFLAGRAPFEDRSRHPLPCLVLLDLKLPDTHGFEVLKWIRAQPGVGSVVVIVLTNSGEYRDIATAYALGANSYLIKPPGAQSLLEQMKAMQFFWLRHSVLPEVR